MTFVSISEEVAHTLVIFSKNEAVNLFLNFVTVCVWKTHGDFFLYPTEQLQKLHMMLDFVTPAILSDASRKSTVSHHSSTGSSNIHSKKPGHCSSALVLHCIKTTTRYAGAPEKVLLMRRKEKPPVLEL